MPDILITSRSFGTITDQPEQTLKDAGWNVIYDNQTFDADRFAEEIRECEGIVIGAHPFPAELMEECKKLRFIAKHGTGLDNIDLPTAKRLGIVVTNTPGANASAVADLTLGLMIDCARHITEVANQVRDGVWKPKTGRAVFGKTIGIVGFGAIGRGVAKRALGFDMTVYTYDPMLTELSPEWDGKVTLCPSLHEMLPHCDFLTLHVPLNDETRDMIDAEELALLPEGAIVVNAARGGVVNEAALVAALESGHLSAAAADTTEIEPMPADHPFRSLPQMTVTSHIGMYTYEAINAISQACADAAAAFLRGEPVRNVTDMIQ